MFASPKSRYFLPFYQSRKQPNDLLPYLYLIDSVSRHIMRGGVLNGDDLNLLTGSSIIASESLLDNVSGRSRRLNLGSSLILPRNGLGMAKEADRRYSVELELQQLLSKLEKHQEEEAAESTMGETHAAYALFH
jgi:hypothetical protein